MQVLIENQSRLPTTRIGFLMLAKFGPHTPTLARIGPWVGMGMCAVNMDQ